MHSHPALPHFSVHLRLSSPPLHLNRPSASNPLSQFTLLTPLPGRGPHDRPELPTGNSPQLKSLNPLPEVLLD